ncbi:MAG: precorrin-6A reductase [Lachnospiraceae bacterium]|nr:precorrin-6A reductase [Lachnospiraceae bacterium]
MSEIIVFGGTTEGRVICEALSKRDRDLLYFVATDFGKDMLEGIEEARTRVGRLDETAMEELFGREKPKLVIDATHPYATAVTANIKHSCENTGVKLIRVLRDNEGKSEAVSYGNTFECDDIEQMTDILNKTDDIILSTLGVKEAPYLTRIKDFEKRVFVRVLPTEESMEICETAGIKKERIIAALGPFGVDENIKAIRDTGANVLITKESGSTGGFRAKIEAARITGIRLGIIRRPKETEGISAAELIRMIENRII